MWSSWPLLLHFQLLGQYLYVSCMHAKLLQLCLTLFDPMDCSLPDSSVLGILQARILKWVVMPSSRGSSWLRDWTHVSCSPGLQADFLPLSHLGSPCMYHALDKMLTEYMINDYKTGEYRASDQDNFLLGVYQRIWLPSWTLIYYFLISLLENMRGPTFSVSISRADIQGNSRLITVCSVRRVRRTQEMFVWAVGVQCFPWAEK